MRIIWPKFNKKKIIGIQLTIILFILFGVKNQVYLFLLLIMVYL